MVQYEGNVGRDEVGARFKFMGGSRLLGHGWGKEGGVGKGTQTSDAADGWPGNSFAIRRRLVCHIIGLSKEVPE